MTFAATARPFCAAAGVSTGTAISGMTILVQQTLRRASQAITLLVVFRFGCHSLTTTETRALAFLPAFLLESNAVRRRPRPRPAEAFPDSYSPMVINRSH